MLETPTLHVKICVALSESGKVECVPYDDCNIQVIENVRKFLAEKRSDKVNWQITYLSADIPMPFSAVIPATIKNRP